MKKSGIAWGVLAALVILLIYQYFFRPENTEPQEKVHLHAGFIVYKDNERVDFTDLKYMSITPCSDDEHEQEDLTAEEKQIEKAHLHDSVGDVVHVHEPNVLWKDIFTNINYPMDGSVTGYINGKKVDNILELPIKAFDSVVFLTGENTAIEEKSKETITRSYIEDVEKKSETCGTD